MKKSILAAGFLKFEQEKKIIRGEADLADRLGRWTKSSGALEFHTSPDSSYGGVQKLYSVDMLNEFMSEQAKPEDVAKQVLNDPRVMVVINGVFPSFRINPVETGLRFGQSNFVNKIAPVFFLENSDEARNAQTLKIHKLTSKGIMVEAYDYVVSVDEAYGLREAEDRAWLAKRIEEKSKPSNPLADSKNVKTRL